MHGEPLGPVARVLYACIRSLIAGVAKLLGRVEVRGREHVPATGAFVLAPVHRSNIDFALASLVTRRRLRYMAKDSVWKSKPLGAFVSFLGGFPVNRGAADREALRTCVAVLEAGEPLVMFPEGTRRSGAAVEARAGDRCTDRAAARERGRPHVAQGGEGLDRAAADRGAEALRRGTGAARVAPSPQVTGQSMCGVAKTLRTFSSKCDSGSVS